MQEITRQDFAIAATAAGIFHNVFYRKPCAEFLRDVRVSGLLHSWPYEDEDSRKALARIEEGLRQSSDLDIEKDFYQLFVGPGAMAAYPYGSVYTDKENLVCGQTTREFVEFCRAVGVNFKLPHPEPEDHIGLVLGALARLFEEAADSGDESRVGELLGQHCLPWVHRWLERVESEAVTCYYQGFAGLLRQFLEYWSGQLAVVPRELQLYA